MERPALPLGMAVEHPDGISARAVPAPGSGARDFIFLIYRSDYVLYLDGIFLVLERFFNCWLFLRALFLRECQ